MFKWTSCDGARRQKDGRSSTVTGNTGTAFGKQQRARLPNPVQLTKYPQVSPVLCVSSRTTYYSYIQIYMMLCDLNEITLLILLGNKRFSKC